MESIAVAGHLCLDIFPELNAAVDLTPGKLINVGRATISTGGCVSNVGIALDRLGVKTHLVAKISEDEFGGIVRSILRDRASSAQLSLSLTSHAPTSYSIVLSPPGEDRTFLHAPGCNDIFGVDDIDFESISGAKHFHFGYPPLMAKMFAGTGEELTGLLKTAKSFGLTTSLDMSLPDINSASGKAPWKEILRNALPYVDLFIPSEDELTFMLGGQHDLETTCLDFGAKAVVIKCGGNGVRGSCLADNPFGWTGSAEHSCFKVNVVGTTGAGDATIAGILFGIANGWSFKQCLEAGCGVGACCVMAADATSGIQNWGNTQALIQAWKSD